MSKTEIECIYRARIDFVCDKPEAEDKVLAFAFAIRHVNVESTGGGPAWGNYLIVEGENRDDVCIAVREIEKRIRRFKGGRIL